MGNNRSSTSSSSATSSYSQYTHSIPNKNFTDKNNRQFWKTSISARESFDNSPQQKEETKTRLRNRSLVLFQQPKLNKGGGNNNWWPLKRIKNRSIEKKNSYGVPPPSLLFDEINGEEEEIQSLENRPLIDLTVTSSENNSPCSSLPPNQPTTIDDSNTTTTTSTTTTTFISFRPQRCQFLENSSENFVENKNNNSEFNKHQRRAKSFRHFPSTKTCNNSRRSTRFSTASGSAHLLKKSPFISNICPITGLTPIQRRMIIERVCKLKTLDLHIFCSSTYKNVFEKYPKLISYFCLNTSIKRKKSEKEIIKEEEEENKKERNGKGICRRLSSIGIFRMLVRRFFNVLQLVLILLEEGQSSIIEQILLEFGGMHANNNRGNEEKEEVEREGEEREEDISLIPQEYWEILLQSLLNLTNKEENIYVKTQNGQHLFDVSTSNYSKRSVEAWTLFCIFIVSKIRFGFVMECFLHSNFKNKKRDVQQKFNKNINSENTQQIIYDFRRNSISNENILFYKEKIK